MITTRDELLTAIRRAEMSSQGIIVGPLVWVGDQHIRFGKVVDEATRRALLTRIKLANSRNFQPESTWELPKCSAKTKQQKSRTTKAATR